MIDNRLRKVFWLLLFAGICSCFSTALAVQEPTDVDEADQMSNQATALTELDRKMKTLVSVDFRETPIEDVIKSLAEQADIDMIKSPQVTGNVTATLTNVPLDEAIESILAVHGYGYIATESIVRIVPQAQLAQQRVKLVTTIYHIDYAKVEDVVTALKEVLSSHGRIATNRDTNHIMVTETESQMELIDGFIQEMDRETPQILVEASIYDISCSDYLDLGIEWFASRLTSFDSETGRVSGGQTTPFVQGLFSAGISQAPYTESGLRFGVLNENVEIDATIYAAQDKIRAKLLANPKILVVDRQAASIKIVSEIPYQELTQTSGGGNIGTTRFKDVGIELTVTPYLTRDEKIMLEVNPVFSVQSGTVSMAIPAGLQTISTAQPIVDKREAQTQALIRNGQTVVIGGLRKKDTVQEIGKVPLVGDIPWLGELFKFRGEKTVNSELVVFITPRIIAEAALSAEEIKQLENAEEQLCEPEAASTIFDCCENECY